LRFSGKKRQIDIPEVEVVSEVKPALKVFHFLLYFVVLALFLLLIPQWATNITGWLVSVVLALVGTIFSWWQMGLDKVYLI
jgi:hypothetical protein